MGVGEEEGISVRGRGRGGPRRWWKESGLTAPSPAPSPRQSGWVCCGGVGGLSWPHLEPRGPGKSSGGDNGAVSVGE